MPKTIAMVWDDNKAYFFRGSEYVRYDIVADRADEGYPQPISSGWTGVFEEDIDAAVVWPNGKAYFFRGDEYVRYDIAADRADAGYPQSISSGWPGVFEQDIDAAVVWSNGKAYFFSDDEYIRYDIAADQADDGYPQPISSGWPGVFEEDIDAAVVWPNGKAYFFQGDSYQRYDLEGDAVDGGYPQSISAWGLPFNGSRPASVKGDDGDGGAPRDRQAYLSQAYINAFGTYDEPDWDPEQGYAANRDRIVKLYDYYRDTYLKRPDQFLWAGLGRMAGGAVVTGLDLVVFHGGETFLTKTMVRIGKAIFHDLAWLHEAFLDDPQLAIDNARTQDAHSPSRRSYADAFTDIASGDRDRIVNGNRALLENEQFSIIQPLYDDIANSSEALIFRRTRAFTSKIHPYHRDFLVRFPTGDVITAQDRWDWITEEDGMWAKWETMGSVASEERTRLVSLTFSDILAQRFDPVVDELMPTGANSED